MTVEKKLVINPGDKVRIMSNYCNPSSYNPGWVTNMDEYLGEILTVKEVSLNNCFKVEENRFTWSIDWIDANLTNNLSNPLNKLLLL